MLSHYSEKLLILDGLTPLTRWYDLTNFDISPVLKTKQGRVAFRKRFKIPAEVTVYACLQTIYKLSPRMDNVTREILTRDPDAVVLFKELPMTDQVGKQVKARLRQTLSGPLLRRVHFMSPWQLATRDLRRVHFLPPLSDSDYRDTFAIVDVILDSYPFGGHTSTMDAFSAGCPVVTLPTDFLSGRCTQGFLREMGLGELVATDLDDYIEKALWVGMDLAYRAKIVAIIQAKWLFNSALLRRKLDRAQ
ncbi:glycosyl transferase family 41-domain-containing protein [Baffinella frigidus]|nr:glycosyl transferase family 41-domain-containing protein [Cryptophyta sp. CCMP2293]